MRNLRTTSALVACLLLLAGCGLQDARKQAIANAAVTPLDMNNSLRPGLVGLTDYPSTGWEYAPAAEVPTSGTVTQAQLSRIGLQDGDVGSGLTVMTIVDGDTLNAPTLDLCDAKYPSESLRIARLQKGTYDGAGEFAGISSEVVAYANEDAAKQALKEVIKARKDCPTGKAINTPDGHSITFEFHGAPGPASTPLVEADSRLIVHTTMEVDGVARRAFLVYQILGRVLAALYVSEDGTRPFDQQSLDSFYGLAGDMANRLRTSPDALLYGTSEVGTQA